MVKASKSLFKINLILLDTFSKHLSSKFHKSIADCPNHIKAIIIAKIVRMFHTLELIVDKSRDEVSACCILRGLLDGITTYCFIYDRDDEDEILFRHYLYALDGFRCYRSSVAECIFEKNYTAKSLKDECDFVIKQIEDRLTEHPYSKNDNNLVNEIIKGANWKYKSLSDSRKWKFCEMYRIVGISDSIANYFQGYLSQFSHGLCLSNTPINDEELLERVLYESIVIEKKTINAIKATFPKESWKEIAISIFDSLMTLLDNSEISREELIEFFNSYNRNDGVLEIS